MMQFTHTLEAVLNGTKTQTSRVVKPGDACGYLDSRGLPFPALPRQIEPHFIIKRVYRGTRILWQMGNTYAVQPGRGKKAVARIKLLRIRMMDVRRFGFFDIVHEGVKSSYDFYRVWCGMHDKIMLDDLNSPEFFGALNFSATVYKRPAERYLAWVLNFELVK